MIRVQLYTVQYALSDFCTCTRNQIDTLLYNVVHVHVHVHAMHCHVMDNRRILSANALPATTGVRTLARGTPPAQSPIAPRSIHAAGDVESTRERSIFHRSAQRCRSRTSSREIEGRRVGENQTIPVERRSTRMEVVWGSVSPKSRSARNGFRSAGSISAVAARACFSTTRGTVRSPLRIRHAVTRR